MLALLNLANTSLSCDLHYSAAGYRTLGRRFAEKAIGLIKNAPNKALN